jgi:hypothetical protein
MKTKILLLIAAVAFVFASCSKDNDTPDPYAAFRADATPRWENGTTIEKNETSAFSFVTDKGNNLFASDKFKTGRISANGSDYEIIEFNGAAVAGKPTGAAIRKPSGITNLHSLEILKTENGILWIVFKETETSTERRIVQ